MKKKYHKQRSGQQQVSADILYSGFLLTCDKNREREAVKEAYQLIEQYVEQIYPQESQKYEQLLEENSQNKMLYNFDTKVKCVIFIRINSQLFPTLDVDELSRLIFNDVYDRQLHIARYIYRMIPIQYVFRAQLQEFEKYAQILVNKYFQLDRPHPWFLIFKTRYTEQIKKQQVLQVLQKLIEPLHYQDWQEPEFVFFVEVNGAIMYINLLPKYHEYNEYSIRKGGQPIQDDIIQKKDLFHQIKKKTKVEEQQQPQINIQNPNSDFQKKEFFEEQDVDLL